MSNERSEEAVKQQGSGEVCPRCGAPCDISPDGYECAYAPPSAPVGVAGFKPRAVAFVGSDGKPAWINPEWPDVPREPKAPLYSESEVMRALAQQPAAVDEAWLSKARSLYDRCSVYPETKPDGMAALLELRNHVYSILATQHQAGLADKPCPYREPTA